MNTLLISSILTILAIQSISTKPTAMDIADQLETKIGSLIKSKDTSGLKALFTSDFKFGQCKKGNLDRDGRVNLLMNRFATTPIGVPRSAEFISDSELFYLCDEVLQNGDMLATRAIVKKIDEQWVISEELAIECK